MAPNGLDDTYHGELHQHGAGTKADKRKRNARDGHKPDAHTDVLKDLKRPHAHQANGDQLKEERIALYGDANAREDEQDKQSQKDDCAHKAKLLRQQCEHKSVWASGRKPSAA